MLLDVESLRRRDVTIFWELASLNTWTLKSFSAFHFHHQELAVSPVDEPDFGEASRLLINL